MIAFLVIGRSKCDEEHSQIPICNGDGIPTWAEYIALTDPNDAASRFSATISIGADGLPTIGWNTTTYASRTYKVFGKVDLSDSVWIEVKDNVELYRFFKVTIELK